MTTNLIFHRLFNAPHIDIVGVGVTKTLSKNKGGVSGVLEVLRKTDYRYWLFLVFTNGFFFANRITSVIQGKPKSGHKHIINVAKAASIPITYSSNFSSNEFIAYLKTLNTDLLVIRVNQILSAEILKVPKIDTWCVHSSLLPSYKGIAGEFHAINHNETTIGSTIFQVTPKLDEGKSVAQISVPVENKKSLFYHILKNNLAAADLVFEKVTQMSKAGKTEFDEIKYSDSSYFSWPKPKDVSLFLKTRKLIGTGEAISFFLKCIFKKEL